MMILRLGSGAGDEDVGASIGKTVWMERVSGKDEVKANIHVGLGMQSLKARDGVSGKRSLGNHFCRLRGA